MVETEPTGCKENMAAKGPVKGDRVKTPMVCLHISISELLSSLSHLGLSYLYPGSLVTENLSFYKLINLRSRSQKSCKSTLNSDFLCPLTALIEDQNQTYQVFGMNCVKLEEFKQDDPGEAKKIFLALF